MAELIEACGASEIFSINLHEDGLRNLFRVPAHNISAMPLIAEYIGKNLDDPVIIAPDKGALGFAQEIASILGCDSDHLEKTRISPDKVETKTKNLDVKGREAVIIDDIISTGGTIINTSKMLRQHGASKIVVSCVHPVLVEDALLRIFATGADEVIATDTLQSDVSTISVAPLIADFMGK
ncbi:MAG TPA: ribose-phosphate diphosphokinase, partial [Methanobacterium sp.]